MQMHHSFSKHAAYADNLAKQWIYKDIPLLIFKYQLCVFKGDLDFL